MSNSASCFVDYKAVKATISIIQVLERYGILKSFRQSGDSYSGSCPLHNGDNPTQFRISISKNCWNCFGKCKRGGNVIDFVSLKEGIGFREAALRIQEWFGLESKPPSKQVHKTEATHAPKPVVPPKNGGEGATTSSARPEPVDEREEVTENKPLSFSLAHLDPTHPYLATRGLTPASVETFGLGFCAKGVMADRIAIPIHNRTGQLVAYVGRFPGKPSDGQCKYRLPKGFRKSLEVFNIHRAAEADPRDSLVVVEGFFDCIAVWQAGYHRVVSIMGSALSEPQAQLLTSLVGSYGRILLLFDEDNAGREGRAKTLTRLAPHAYVKARPCGPEGTQPDHLSAEQLRKLVI